MTGCLEGFDEQFEQCRLFLMHQVPGSFPVRIFYTTNWIVVISQIGDLMKAVEIGLGCA